ncbi:MAG: hypothetical protein OEY16_01760 [Alphaproteobacteria bacterium]|nr:hypothetical protein [Alphaproteobacteria bacterium]
MLYRSITSAARTLGLTVLALSVQFVEARAMLEDVTVAADQGCTVVRVGFDEPILYQRHFPYESGIELLVFVRPVSIGPAELAAGLPWEILSIPPEEDPVLLSVVFQGDAPGGPYLSVRFTRRVAFKVQQGRDYRSIVISISDSEMGAPCPREN